MEFSTPIEFKFQNDDEDNIFSSSKDILDWATNELERWQKWEKAWDSLERRIMEKYPLQLHSLVLHWQDFIQDIHRISHDEPDLRNSIENQLNSLSEIVSCTTHSSKGDYIDNLIAKDPLLAFATLANWEPNIWHAYEWYDSHNHSNTSKSRYVLLNKGAASALNFELGISPKSAASAQKKLTALQAKNNRLSQELEQNRAACEAFFKDTQDAQENALSGWKKLQKITHHDVEVRIAEYEELYREKLANEASVSYWSKKSVEHKKTAKNWMWAFVIGIVGLLGYITFHLNMANLPKASDTNALIIAITISLPIVIAIWFLKFLLVGYRLHIAKAHDAEERTIMTQTFLALMSEKQATQEDRILILNALFRPSNTNPHDDGTPVHWFDLLLERTKKP
tara:strand:+ start:524 stop:1711 length:1188 start_codon:yes stop_codon:yes gene_type:complete